MLGLWTQGLCSRHRAVSNSICKCRVPGLCMFPEVPSLQGCPDWLLSASLTPSLVFHSPLGYITELPPFLLDSLPPISGPQPLCTFEEPGEHFQLHHCLGSLTTRLRLESGEQRGHQALCFKTCAIIMYSWGDNHSFRPTISGNPLRVQGHHVPRASGL